MYARLKAITITEGKEDKENGQRGDPTTRMAFVVELDDIAEGGDYQNRVGRLFTVEPTQRSLPMRPSELIRS